MEGLLSFLTPQQQAMARQQGQTQGLIGLGSALLQASQGQPGQRRPSLGMALGQAAPVGLQAYQGGMDQTLRDIVLGQQMQDAQAKRAQQAAQQAAIQRYASTVPKEERPLFEAFPELAIKARLEREKPSDTPVQRDYQTAVQQGYKGTFLDYQTALKQAGRTQVTATATTGGGDLTPGQKKVDEKFADDFVSWTSGGGQDMAAQIAQLKPVISALEQGKPITGLQVAIQPDLLLAMTNPEALQSREQVEEVVQRNLRVILGAQFTEKEGERLIARAFNPKLPPQENAKRLRRLFLQMSTAAEQKQAMADYFQESGTLRGYKGKMPSVQDFYNAMEGSAPTFSGDSSQSLQDQARRILEQRRGGR